MVYKRAATSDDNDDSFWEKLLNKIVDYEQHVSFYRHYSFSYIQFPLSRKCTVST
jgi:hypothetical protein